MPEKIKDRGISRCYSASFRKIARYRDLDQDRGIPRVSPTELGNERTLRVLHSYGDCDNMEYLRGIGYNLNYYL